MINDYIYSYYENLFFYSSCDAVFYKIIKENQRNVYLKDEFGPCSHYIFDKLINYYQRKNNIYILLDDTYNIYKPYAIFTKQKYISISSFYFDFDLHKIYYKKSNNTIDKLIKFRKDAINKNPPAL